MIQGTAITLFEQTVNGFDGFGEPIYIETPVIVENVLVGQPSPQERTDDLESHRATRTNGKTGMSKYSERNSERSEFLNAASKQTSRLRGI